MCYAPLHIRNNALHFDSSRDRMFLNVPCGQCGECRQKRTDDTTARLYYQFLETEKTKVPGFFYKAPDGSFSIDGHGYTYMETLTYNEDMVPVLHGIKCFRPDDWRAFMKNLRADWYKEFDSSTLKVYMVSEYGGETYRPHYHPVFFVTAPCTPEHLEELIQRNWCLLKSKNGSGSKTNTRTSLGWTDISNPYSHKHDYPYQLVVDGLSVFAYCAQYVNKDVDFEKVLKDQLNGHYDGLPITEEDYKCMRPFTRQSHGIGECIKDILSIDDLMDGKMVLPDKLRGEKIISLPLYIDRKVFYDYDPSDKCFKLNEQGYKMKEVRREHNHGYVKKQIDYLMSQMGLLWTDSSVQAIQGFSRQQHVNSKFGDMTTADAMCFVSDTLYGRMDDFVDYIVYFKDISSTYAVEVDDGCDLKRLAETFVVKKYNSPPVYDLCLNEYAETHPVDYRKFLRSRYGSVCDRFAGFDDVLAILNGVNLAYCQVQQQAYMKRLEERSRQKKIYKQSLYSQPKYKHSLNRQL